MNHKCTTLTCLFGLPVSCFLCTDFSGYYKSIRLAGLISPVSFFPFLHFQGYRKNVETIITKNNHTFRVFSKVRWALIKPPFLLRILSGVAQNGSLGGQREDLELFPRDHHCNLSRTFCRQEWKHTKNNIDNVPARGKGENKRKTAGREEELDWMYLTVSYGKIFISWVWGVQSSNSEFDSHYYLLAWVTNITWCCCYLPRCLRGWWG